MTAEQLTEFNSRHNITQLGTSFPPHSSINSCSGSGTIADKKNRVRHSLHLLQEDLDTVRKALLGPKLVWDPNKRREDQLPFIAEVYKAVFHQQGWSFFPRPHSQIALTDTCQSYRKVPSTWRKTADFSNRSSR